MNCEKIAIGNDGAYLETYFLGSFPDLLNSHRRPAVLICPGGAYCVCSDREAEPVALALCARGISAAVLRYPCAPAARFPVQLCAAAQAVAWLKGHAEENNLDPLQISIMGFSAGGHLAASLGVFWDRPFLARETGLSPEDMRPAKLVLGYPVITSGEFITQPSFLHLLGDEGFADAEKMRFVSLENQVTGQVPPVFLWHTVSDPAVPVENSMLFAAALRKAGVPFEAHFYSVGTHGLSLANRLTESAGHDCVQPECAGWIDLAADWLLR